MKVDTMTVASARNWGWRHASRKAWAAKDISFDLHAGERVLLLGASGSGKSTLLQGLSGVLDPEEGESTGSLDVPQRGKVALVQQDPDSQVVMDQIGNEVAFGCENLGVPADQIWDRVEGALAEVGLDLPLTHPTSALSGGQKQRLAIASALAMQPQVILLDEPTANLDPTGARKLHETVSNLGRNQTLVIVEHHIDLWLDTADRMIVLDHGSIIADGKPDEVLQEQGATLLDAGLWVPGAPTPVPLDMNVEATSSIMDVTDLSVGYQKPVRAPVTQSFERQLSHCIVGENGSGKTTLALTLAGLLPALAGRIETSFGDLPADPGTWKSADLPNHIGMVFQEPSYQFLTDTVFEELALPLKLAGVDKEAIERDVNAYLTRMSLDHLARAHPLTLSGGEKRRLAVGSVMIASPKILILDEPTFGQDRNTWVALIDMLRDLVDAGTTIISITHDEEYVKVMGQRILRLESSTADQSATEEEVTAPRINPLIQVAGLALMTLPLIASIDWISATVALVLEALLLPLLGFKISLRKLWPLLVAALLAASSMLLYAEPGGHVYWNLGLASINDNSLMLSLGIGLRVLAVAAPAIIILSNLNATHTADAFTQVGHFPTRPVLATLAGIRLVSLMLADWDALKRARRSRGVSDGSRIPAFFRGAFSLFAFALRRAGTLSLTMEARGFGADTPRSHARTSQLSRRDLPMVLVSILIPVTALGTAIALGAFRWLGM